MIKNKSKPIILFVVLLLLAGMAMAQESVNASGGDARGSGGTVTYSLGEIFYTTSAESTGSVAQGVQHAYQIFTVGINETALDISLIVFPNPTTENLTLQISDYDKENLLYQLFDVQGKQLSSGEILSSQTEINTATLPAAIYFITVVDEENKIVQSFKIIKN